MSNSFPLLIAHRGDSQNYPENSIEAFKSAFDLGSQGVELDIHERNKKLIVVHNYNHGEDDYPTLDQVLGKFAGMGRLEVEVKTIGLSFIDPLKELLEQYPDEDIELTTSVAGLFAYLKPNFPKQKIGCIFPAKEFETWMFEENDFYITKVIKSMELHKADIAHLPFEVCTTDLIAGLHNNGFKAHTNLAGQSNDLQVERFRLCRQLGIDQLTFDNMDLLKQVASK